MAQERLDNVQLLRAVAAIGVVIQHGFDQFRNHPMPGMQMLVSPIGGVWANGIDLFFVISGFIMFYLTHDRFNSVGYSREFIHRRIIRVVPIYWLFTTAMLAIAMLSPGEVNGSAASLWHIIASYLFVPAIGPDGSMYPLLALGWTLNYEFFFYACFAIALLAPRRIGLTGLVIFFVALVAAHPLLPAGPMAFWSDSIILEFLAGILIAGLYVRGVRIRRWALTVTLLLVGVSLMVVFYRAFPEAPRLIRNGIPSMMVAAVLILTPNVAWPRGLILIGDASYSLYLSHPFALAITTKLWEKLGLPNIGIAYLAALVISSVMLGVVVHLFLERRLISIFKRLFDPKPRVVLA